MGLPMEQVGRSLLGEGPTEVHWAVWKAGEVLGTESKSGQRMPNPWEKLSRGGKRGAEDGLPGSLSGKGQGEGPHPCLSDT